MGPRAHIAYLVGRYPAVSHTFVLREIRALRQRGLRVDTLSIWRSSRESLLSQEDREEFETTFAALPAPLSRIAAAHLLALRTHPIRYFRALRTALTLAAPGARNRLWSFFYFVEAVICWRHVRRLGVRHVHAQFSGHAATAAMLIAKLEDSRRTPFTWSMAVHGPLEFYDVTVNRLAQKVADADLVIAISDYARSQLMALVSEEHWSKIEVVHCGVDPAVFSGNGRADRSPSGGIHVLSVGRLVSLKGHGVLIEALAQLRDRGVPATATVVGDGPRREALQNLAGELGLAERIEFAGAVGQDEIREHYERSDVFCLPSFGEGVPVVLMEAMAMGKPVVTSRITGIPELVDDGVSGILTSPGRSDQVAEALTRLARDATARHAMGEAGRAKVAGDFNVHRSAEQLGDIYAERLPHAHLP